MEEHNPRKGDFNYRKKHPGPFDAQSLGNIVIKPPRLTHALSEFIDALITKFNSESKMRMNYIVIQTEGGDIQSENPNAFFITLQKAIHDAVELERRNIENGAEEKVQLDIFEELIKLEAFVVSERKSPKYFLNFCHFAKDVLKRLREFEKAHAPSLVPARAQEP